MKAKEYYASIKEAIETGTATALKKAIDEMFLGMNHEVQELQKKRHVRFDRGIFPIIKEMNDKWNAVVSLIENDYGESPIVRTDSEKGGVEHETSDRFGSESGAILEEIFPDDPDLHWRRWCRGDGCSGGKSDPQSDTVGSRGKPYQP